MNSRDKMRPQREVRKSLLNEDMHQTYKIIIYGRREGEAIPFGLDTDKEKL